MCICVRSKDAQKQLARTSLTPVRGSNYRKVREFYEKLSKNFDALQTLEEGEKVHGLVMATLNKLSQVRPYLVRVDEN